MAVFQIKIQTDQTPAKNLWLTDRSTYTQFQNPGGLLNMFDGCLAGVILIRQLGNPHHYTLKFTAEKL